MGNDPDDYGAPPPDQEPEPARPAPDNSWISMDIIEKSEDRQGIEHRNR
ncbi:MAG: hypothetical protein H0V42_12710 [Nocardioidaceae bacterium]|nr:hypothetical protein [Nocardioidaceae bacterium]